MDADADADADGIGIDDEDAVVVAAGGGLTSKPIASRSISLSPSSSSAAAVWVAVQPGGLAGAPGMRSSPAVDNTPLILMDRGGRPGCKRGIGWIDGDGVL